MLPRNVAEERYGFGIYQGGAIPGKNLRIVEIKGFDVEACGGTHLHLTGEAKIIKILKTSKIQDGVVRIEFAAGNAAAEELEKEAEILQEAARLLGCHINEVPGRAKELFNKWKRAVKKKKANCSDDFTLTSHETSENSEPLILKEAALILKTQPEHIAKTIKRFKEDLERAYID